VTILRPIPIRKLNSLISYLLETLKSKKLWTPSHVRKYLKTRKAALAYEGAAILIYGDDAETNFPPEGSEQVVLSDQVVRQINVFKEGRASEATVAVSLM
jgi:hypothetical protein